MSQNVSDLPIDPAYPQPHGAMVATLQSGTRKWRFFLGEPSIESIVRQVGPNGHSIGMVLLHMAESEQYWMEQVCLRQAPKAEDAVRFKSAETDAFEGIWPAPPRESIHYFLGILDEVREKTLHHVKSFGSLDETRESDWGTNTLGWILSHIIWHDAYHGGQAVLMNEEFKALANGPS